MLAIVSDVFEMFVNPKKNENDVAKTLGVCVLQPTSLAEDNKLRPGEDVTFGKSHQKFDGNSKSVRVNMADLACL